MHAMLAIQGRRAKEEDIAMHTPPNLGPNQSRHSPVWSLTAQMTPSLPAHTRAKPTMAPTAGAEQACWHLAHHSKITATGAGHALRAALLPK